MVKQDFLSKLTNFHICYLHEVCGVGSPVRSVFGSHVQSLFPQLPSERVLEAAEDKHHPLHDPVERDLLRGLWFSFLLFGFGFGFGRARPLLVCRLLCRGSWKDELLKLKQVIQVKKWSVCRGEWCTFRGAGARCAGWARLVFGGRGFALRWASWANFLWGWRARGILSLFAELKLSFSRWLWGIKVM